MKIHIVKKGDTLYEIAKNHNVSLEQIIALNPQIANPNEIDVGMKVKIPSLPKPVKPPVVDHVYKHTVVQGDSLWKLGKAWGVPLQAMIQANPHLKNPNVLMTGEVVYIPKAAATDTIQEQVAMEMPLMPDHVALPTVFEGPMGDISPISTPTPVPTQSPSTMSVEMEMVSFQQTQMPLANVQPALINPPCPEAIHPFEQHQIPAQEAFSHHGMPMFTGLPEQSGMPLFPWGVQPEAMSLPQMHAPAWMLPTAGGDCGCHAPTLPPTLPPTMPPTMSLPQMHAPASMFPTAGGDCGCHTPTMPPVMPESWQTAYTSDVPNPRNHVSAMPFAGHSDMSIHPPYYPVGADTQMGYFPSTMGSPLNVPYPTPPFTTPNIPSHDYIQQLMETGEKEREEEQSAETRSIEGTTQARGKTIGNARKSKASNSKAEVTANLKLKQSRQSKAEVKPNLPWINV